MQRERERCQQCSRRNMIYYIASDAGEILNYCAPSLSPASPSSYPLKKQNGVEIDLHLSAGRTHFPLPKGLMKLCLSLPHTHTHIIYRIPKSFL